MSKNKLHILSLKELQISNLIQKFDAALWKPRRFFVDSILNFSVKRGNAFVIERKVATQKGVQENAHRPKDENKFQM